MFLLKVHSGQRVGNNMVPPMIPHDPMLGPPMMPMPQLSGEMMQQPMPPHPVMPPQTALPPSVQEMASKQGKSKAGPPPDRRMEGSIDVIGGERGNLIPTNLMT